MSISLFLKLGTTLKRHQVFADIQQAFISFNNHIIQIYSGITSGRVLDGGAFYTKILEANLFAFAYRLYHEDFSPINAAPRQLERNLHKRVCRQIQTT